MHEQVVRRTIFSPSSIKLNTMKVNQVDKQMLSLLKKVLSVFW